MSDTSREVELRFRNMMMRRSPGERLAMACRMFTTARTLVLAGIAGSPEELDPGELRGLLFRRTYGKDFSPEQIARIVSALGAT